MNTLPLQRASKYSIINFLLLPLILCNIFSDQLNYFPKTLVQTQLLPCLKLSFHICVFWSRKDNIGNISYITTCTKGMQLCLIILLEKYLLLTEKYLLLLVFKIKIYGLVGWTCQWIRNGWSHSKSCGTQLNVQLEIKKDWCPSRAGTGTGII